MSEVIDLGPRAVGACMDEGGKFVMQNGTKLALKYVIDCGPFGSIHIVLPPGGEFTLIAGREQVKINQFDGPEGSLDDRRIVPVKT